MAKKEFDHSKGYIIYEDMKKLLNQKTKFKQGTGNTFLYIYPEKKREKLCEIIKKTQDCKNCQYTTICPYSPDFIELGERE